MLLLLKEGPTLRQECQLLLRCHRIHPSVIGYLDSFICNAFSDIHANAYFATFDAGVTNNTASCFSDTTGYTSVVSYIDSSICNAFFDIHTNASAYFTTFEADVTNNSASCFSDTTGYTSVVGYIDSSICNAFSDIHANA
jgi:hypothetical protein